MDVTVHIEELVLSRGGAEWAAAVSDALGPCAGDDLDAEALAAVGRAVADAAMRPASTDQHRSTDNRSELSC